MCYINLRLTYLLIYYNPADTWCLPEIPQEGVRLAEPKLGGRSYTVTPMNSFCLDTYSTLPVMFD